MFDCPAYRALKPTARALLWELIRRFNGSNNGSIGLGEREAAEALGLRDRMAIRSQFAVLEAKGFIVCTWRGGFNVKTGPQSASEWLLTWLPAPNGVEATKDFMRLPPDCMKENRRDRFSVDAGQVICPAG